MDTTKSTKKQMTRNKIEAIGNGITLLLGIAFLGDIFDIWSFNPFSGWWVLFLYIPAICGFLTKGLTAGGVMLTLTAIVLTVGLFTDVDGRLWSAALVLFIAYLGGRTFFRKWNATADRQTDNESAAHHAL